MIFLFALFDNNQLFDFVMILLLLLAKVLGVAKAYS